MKCQILFFYQHMKHIINLLSAELNQVVLKAKYGMRQGKNVSSTRFLFSCSSLFSFVAFVLSLFVPHLSFFWSLRKAVLRECGISWISALIFQ